MRVPGILLASLVGGLCVPSCSEAPERGHDGTGDHAAALETKDDDASFGADPDVGAGIGAAPIASPAPVSAGNEPPGDDTSASTKDVCVAACQGGPTARARFCDLVLPAFSVSCRRHVSGSTVACIAWCYWTY
jgi:hypothetical protein